MQLEPPAYVLQFLERILRPLARLAVAQGVRLNWLTECLKRLLVEEAEALTAMGRGKRVAVSTAAMLTGVHRTDVNRLRAQRDAGGAPTPAGPSIPSRVLSEWTGNALTLDDRGWPMPLPRLASVGGEKSFEAVVRRAHGAVTPRAVLEALLQEGVVRVDADDVVHCRSVVSGGPQRGSNVAERWRANAEVLHDDLAWVAASTGHARAHTQSTRWTVQERGLTRASVQQAQAWYDQEALAFAQRFNALVAGLARADVGHAEAGWRLQMSTSFYFEPADPLGWCVERLPGAAVTGPLPPPAQRARRSGSAKAR